MPIYYYKTQTEVLIGDQVEFKTWLFFCAVGKRGECGMCLEFRRKMRV